ERGERLVGRIAVSGRTEGQSLPEALARVVKPIDPGDRRGTYVADPIRRWQRRDVQQDAGGAVSGLERRLAHVSPPIDRGLEDCMVHAWRARCDDVPGCNLASSRARYRSPRPSTPPGSSILPTKSRACA